MHCGIVGVSQTCTHLKICGGKTSSNKEVAVQNSNFSELNPPLQYFYWPFFSITNSVNVWVFIFVTLMCPNPRGQTMLFDTILLNTLLIIMNIFI